MMQGQKKNVHFLEKAGFRQDLSSRQTFGRNGVRDMLLLLESLLKFKLCSPWIHMYLAFLADDPPSWERLFLGKTYLVHNLVQRGKL